jgi:diguanylate cyclase (GGDEF)-like protein/putative nucleotidyltransferase with HDIG domain
MKSVADQVASGVTNARLYSRVQRQATTDGLTTLYNHRTGQEKLTEQLRMAERYQRHIAVVMVDVDHFKSINDNYGHPVGDTVLKAVAKLIKSNCRDVDIPIRYGGEEFMIVLPEVNQEGAHVVAERIRRSLASEVILHEGIKLSVTASLGIATFPDDAHDQHHLLELADKALYLSKRMGRNQVHTAADLMFAPAKENKEPAQTAEILAQINSTEFTPPTVSAEAQNREDLVPEVVEMVKTLAQSLYARSEYNKTHHLEVARMSELLGKVMGLSATQIEQIRVAGLLHDVGTLKLPADLLEKEGSFSEEERRLVNEHPVLGAEFLKPVRALKEICEILENHHERWDGTGFPQGIKGEDIPLPARIVSVVDSYHAMISDRPYRPAMTHEQAVANLRKGAGSQWDPFLVDIFVTVLANLQAAEG